MTTRVVIGKSGTKNATIDLDRLVETRLLIQANSGGGKSHLIRKIMEESHGKVQQILLDMEGEFGTLREKYDYILAGKGGDIPAEVRSAELLARKILEMKVSLIVDLYELKHHERLKFVRLFLDAMTNSPKELWHPVLVIVDEAHVFAPEKGESEAMQAVIDIATRGRKRGFCAILATQRLSKLHKDVAAEMINKLIGRTGLDIDMKRASEELGFTSKEQTLALRSLEPGEFYAFGAAISTEIIKVKIGEVKTYHPKSGQRINVEPTPPTDNIRKQLFKLTDLPKEAEQEFKDRNSMRTEIANLRRELTIMKSQKPVEQKTKEVVKQVQIVDKQAVENARVAGFNNGKVDGLKTMWPHYKEAKDYAERLEKAIFMAVKPLTETTQKERPGFLIQPPDFERLKPATQEPVRIEKPVPSTSPIPQSHPNRQLAQAFNQFVETVAPVETVPTDNGEIKIGEMGRKILSLLTTLNGKTLKKSMIALLTKYRVSGTFNKMVSDLKKAGLIVEVADQYMINQEKIGEIIGILGDSYNTDFKSALEDWLGKLDKMPQTIYQELLKYPGQTFSKEEIASMTNYKISGTFNSALAELQSLTLIEKDNEKKYGVSKELLQYAVS